MYVCMHDICMYVYMYVSTYAKTTSTYEEVNMGCEEVVQKHLE